MKSILVLGSQSDDTGETAALQSLTLFVQNAVSKHQPVEVLFCHLDELGYVVSPEQASIRDLRNARELDSYTMVFFRGKLRSGINDVALVSWYLRLRSIICLNSAYENRRATGKVPQMYQLQQLGLPFPKSVSASAHYLPDLIDEQLSYPIVVKDMHGGHGNNNFLVNDRNELVTTLKEHPDIKFIAQEMIPNDGDYRVLLAGNQTLIFHRRGSADSHLNNTSKGGSATLIPLKDFDPVIVAQSRQFAKLCQYELSGVDVMYHRLTGQHYFLEINSQPQIVTGAFTDEKSDILGVYFNELLR